MHKLNNKGSTLIQLLAAAVILSYFLVTVLSNVTSVMVINKELTNRQSAFYHAEDVYNHIVNGDTTPFLSELKTSDLVLYLPDDCNDDNKDLLNVFWDGNQSNKLADISYCTNMMTSTYFDETYLVIYEHDKKGFRALKDEAASTDVMVKYAEGVILDESYLSSKNVNVYGISLFIYYADGRALQYHSIIDLEEY